MTSALIETPYRIAKKFAKNDGKDAVNEIALFDVKDLDGNVLLAAGTTIVAADAKRLAATKDLPDIRIRTRLTDVINYLDAYEEEQLTIGQANIEVDENGYFAEERSSIRVHGVPTIAETENIRLY